MANYSADLNMKLKLFSTNFLLQMLSRIVRVKQLNNKKRDKI